MARRQRVAPAAERGQAPRRGRTTPRSQLKTAGRRAASAQKAKPNSRNQQQQPLAAALQRRAQLKSNRYDALLPSWPSR